MSACWSLKDKRESQPSLVRFNCWISAWQSSCRYLHGLDLIRNPSSNEHKNKNNQETKKIEIPIDILTKIFKDAQSKKKSVKDTVINSKQLERQDDGYSRPRNDEIYVDLADMVADYGEKIKQPKRIRYDTPAWFE